MGFPYDTADWAAADGVIFMGWGSTAPGLYTLIAAICCIAVLVYGQRTEKKKTAAYER